MLRLEHGAGRQHHVAGRNVLAGQPSIRAQFQAFRHDHVVALDAHVFLHEHGVGALGHGRAGENADRLPRLERDIGARAGGQPPGNGEPGVGVWREIGMAHGIAVDRRIIEGRQIDRRHHVLGGDAAARAAQAHALGLGDRRDALADQPLHVRQRQQRAGKRKTVVGELRHTPLTSRPARRARHV